jgi:hypothetical protein
MAKVVILLLLKSTFLSLAAEWFNLHKSLLTAIKTIQLERITSFSYVLFHQVPFFLLNFSTYSPVSWLFFSSFSIKCLQAVLVSLHHRRSTMQEWFGSGRLQFQIPARRSAILTEGFRDCTHFFRNSSELKPSREPKPLPSALFRIDSSLIFLQLDTIWPVIMFH